jgi:hypothetical protein
MDIGLQAFNFAFINYELQTKSAHATPLRTSSSMDAG